MDLSYLLISKLRLRREYPDHSFHRINLALAATPGGSVSSYLISTPKTSQEHLTPLIFSYQLSLMYLI